MNWVRARLSEQSTWSGLAKLAGVAGGMLGFSVSPELAASIVAVGVALSGLINVLWPEKK